MHSRPSRLLLVTKALPWPQASFAAIRGNSPDRLSYLLGYFALVVFAMIAFGSGVPDATIWQRAFLIAGGVAVVELFVLWAMPKPANRLVVAANLYLARLKKNPATGTT